MLSKRGGQIAWEYINFFLLGYQPVGDEPLDPCSWSEEHKVAAFLFLKARQIEHKCLLN